MKDAITRLRYSDGFSHARSMFLLTLVFVQPSSRPWGSRAPSGAVVSAGRSSTSSRRWSGPAGPSCDRRRPGAPRRFRRAMDRVAVGTIGALITGTTLIGRSSAPQPPVRRREGPRHAPQVRTGVRAHVAASVMATLAFAGLGLGRAIASALGGSTARGIGTSRGGRSRSPSSSPRSRSSSVGAASSPARVVVAVVRSGGPGRAPRAGVSGAQRVLRVGLDVRDDLRAARRGRRAGVLGVLRPRAAVRGGARAQLEAVRAGAAAPRSGRKVIESEAGAHRRPYRLMASA